MGMKVIAVLPTGDWAELGPDCEVSFYKMSDAEYREFIDTGGIDFSLGTCYAHYSVPKPLLNEEAVKA